MFDRKEIRKKRTGLKWLVVAFAFNFVMVGVTHAGEQCKLDIDDNGSFDVDDVVAVYHAVNWCHKRTTDGCSKYMEEYPDIFTPYDLYRDLIINADDFYVSYDAYLAGLMCSEMNRLTGLSWGIPGCSIDEHCLGESKYCELCATASCPNCKNCLAACVPYECADAHGVDFGRCEMYMGYTVVNGECVPMSGCGSNGYTFYATKDECEKACLDTCAGDSECETDEFCQFDVEDQCGASGPGTCQERFDGGCYAVYDPVCGCDGNTYGNNCEALRASVSILHDGPCQPAPGECSSNDDCRLFENYCGGCFCEALAIGEPEPYCDPADLVMCFASPCYSWPHQAACQDGQCVVQ